MAAPWEAENWREAPGIVASVHETNSMLARRDYSIACQTPSRNLIGIYAGVWLWWCSTHYQPEMYCREAKAKNSIEPAVLEAELRRMKPRQQVYELIKRDMQRRGRWKLKDRGAPPPAKT